MDGQTDRRGATLNAVPYIRDGRAETWRQNRSNRSRQFHSI